MHLPALRHLPPDEAAVGRPGKAQKILPAVQDLHRDPGDGRAAVHTGQRQPGRGLNRDCERILKKTVSRAVEDSLQLATGIFN